ncbi:unnamed protein product [Lactuca virosa]|uniref:Uncharacterized protein n=1 Tax=Lactuca virosa TaxID=75947 RepID=A0AAU9NSL4_9ASTR|nr:unnamed protein product [Lactuca virosa]
MFIYLSPSKHNLFSLAKGLWSGQPPTMEDLNPRNQSAFTNSISQSTPTINPPSASDVYHRGITQSGFQSISTGNSPSANAIYNRGGSTSGSGIIYSDSGVNPFEAKGLSLAKPRIRWGNARPKQ